MGLPEIIVWFFNFNFISWGGGAFGYLRHFADPKLHEEMLN
jgi:hypothetical protein